MRCLCHELALAGIPLARQVSVLIICKRLPLDDGFRAEFVVDNAVILDIKAVPALLRAYEAPLQTYLGMSGLRVGLILNFRAPRLIDSLRRLVV